MRALVVPQDRRAQRAQVRRPAAARPASAPTARSPRPPPSRAGPARRGRRGRSRRPPPTGRGSCSLHPTCGIDTAMGCAAVADRPRGILEQHRLDARGAEVDPDGQHHRVPSTSARAVASSVTKLSITRRPSDGADHRHLVRAARGKDHVRDARQVRQADADDPLVDRMVQRLALGVDHRAQHVAHAPQRDQFLHRRRPRAARRASEASVSTGRPPPSPSHPPCAASPAPRGTRPAA